MNGWTKPNNTGYLELTGPDAVRFLNGQVTNDVSVDLSDKVIAACVCSMKGKIEALIRITSGFADNSLLIETDAADKEAVLNRLDRYLIADDCEFSEPDTIPEITHVFADDAPTANAREHWRYGIKGFDVFGEFDTSSLEEVETAELQKLKIRHGIPEKDFEITGDEFPASLGLDKWAVDFHKGCYLGQEIVSRIESAGKIPRKLRLFSTAEAYTKNDSFVNEAGKTVATVTRQSVADGDKFLTAVLAKDSFEKPGFEEVEIVYPGKL